MSKKQKSVIGGSFGGLVAAATLSSEFQVIVVDQKDFFEFTPSFHFALTDKDYIDKITSKLSIYAHKHKFQFIHGTVTQLKPNAAKVEAITENISYDLEFDYCIIASGAQYNSEIKCNHLETLDDRIETIANCIDKLAASKSLLILGGGAVGVELAGVLSQTYKNLKIELWTKGDQLLPSFPPRARRLADASLRKAKVEIHTQKSAEGNLESLGFDHVFDCRGNINSPAFLRSLDPNKPDKYIDSRGRIVVDEYFRLLDLKHIFAVGDACISPLQESKMSYNAAIQGQYAAQNIIKYHNNNNAKLKSLRALPNIYAVSTGRSQAIMCMGDKFAFESCLVHCMKCMIEWVGSQNIKTTCCFATMAYLQRQLLIFMAYICSFCCNKKTIPPVENAIPSSSPPDYQKLK